MADYAETIRRVMNGDYDDATDAERDEAVKEIVQICSVGAAAVAVQPLPLVDVALISPIQIAMVQAIGRIRGHHLDHKAVLEILSTFGASIVAQNVIMTAAKFVPIFGWVASISMAYALTWAIGEVADYYFLSGRGASPEELREMFRKTYRQKKAEKESANRSNATLKEKLVQLKEAYAEDLLTEEEFERKKAELLASF